MGKSSIRDYVVYFIVAMMLVLLMASFVIGNIYSRADNAKLTQQGTRAIYEITIGEKPVSSLGE
ncbi:hypothetical protein HMP0721_0854 [Pseudoramibacter alactolyticus ATCC 23263]|jgi:hypothetical protein|uniref:Uncharacterized protein n=1 Tax=Pseudoramibacter alactolyticus ATCC 23263 TaxID=887929 RepID=E6MFU3_9FIRM|nr:MULTISPECIES: hypothetical protein [Pseudoramibacter]EFV02088.1 hypothetical protein HMP0721_0854 [Pseudoramibacter alactolyticus ATCC 23263]